MITREMARGWLRSREMWEDDEAINDVLAAAAQARFRHPGLTDDEVLDGMDVNRDDEFEFSMENLWAVEAEKEG